MSSKSPIRSSAAGKGRLRKKGGDAFAERVLKIVKKIPRGKVLTYGQVATLAGLPRAARVVGGILFKLGPESRLPWQRVINAQGKISTYRVGSGARQRALLEEEGHRFDRSGAVDLKAVRWWPAPKVLKELGIERDLAAVIRLRLDW
ncbi:MAG TPA: cysteine methyltransferase [Deltaproteobacteria bacterium]|nr:cysteine methyltransferase [Deltaproteobacteria bacterium]